MAGHGGPKEWVAHVRRLREAGIRDIEIFPGQGLTGAAAAERLLAARDVLAQEYG
jgi:hypothetical protein